MEAEATSAPAEVVAAEDVPAEAADAEVGSAPAIKDHSGIKAGTWELRTNDEFNDFLALAHREDEEGDVAILWEADSRALDRTIRVDRAVVQLDSVTGGCAGHEDLCGAMKQMVPSSMCRCIDPSGSATVIEPASDPSDGAMDLMADIQATNIDDGTFAIRWGAGGAIWGYLYRSTKSKVELTVAYRAGAGVDLGLPFTLGTADDLIQHERLADADGVETQCDGAGELEARCTALLDLLEGLYPALSPSPICTWSQSKTKQQNGSSVEGCPDRTETRTNYTPGVYEMLDGRNIRGHYLVNRLGAASAGQELCSIDTDQSCTLHIDREQTLEFRWPATWDATKGKTFDCGVPDDKPTHPEAFFTEARNNNQGDVQFDRWVAFATFDNCGDALSHDWKKAPLASPTPTTAPDAAPSPD